MKLSGSALEGDAERGATRVLHSPKGCRIVVQKPRSVQAVEATPQPARLMAVEPRTPTQVGDRSAATPT
jgi:hypothetical protein